MSSELLRVKIKEFKCVCVCINSQSIEKIKLDFNWIFNFAPRVHLSF